ncbi:MAG: T9SS type A sorting domain-containing protein [Hymenobacter sp.]|nr:MAG: T9SS type A sorting domain-containing protein [Hymenobacter sp.]
MMMPFSKIFYSRTSHLPALVWRLLLVLLLCAGGPTAWAQRFAAIGDYGFMGAPERDVANLVKSWNPDFIITLGDNNYDVGDSATIDQNIGQYYHEYIYNYKGRYGPKTFSDRFFPSLGNHDYYTRNGEAYRDYFTLPGNGRYYELVRGDVHLFAVNSDPAEPDGVSATSVQARWLRAALAASTSRWNVVYLHHAPYSSGFHGSTTDLQWPFRAWGASVVLAGHDHNYERLVADSLLYIVNGLGGRSLYPNTRPRLAQSQKSFNADYGALLLHATPDSLTLQFFTRQQILVDSYVLHQRLSPAPKLYPVSPNPFQSTTLVEFSLPSALAIQLRVLNALGQEVAVLRQGMAAAGWHQLAWARNGLPAGLYYLHLQGSNFSQVVKVEID